MVGEQLKAIQERAPAVGEALARARQNRLARLRLLADTLGPFLEGMDEVLQYTRKVEAAFQSLDSLRDVAVLVRRARGDLEIDIEAICSGLPLAASNAMRDLMEVHYLLRDFLHDQTRIGLWVSVDNDKRVSKFGPGKLRSRHAARLGIEPRYLADTNDYRIHSMFLHPMPWESPRVPFGISQSAEHLEPLILSWDATHHAVELVTTLHDLLEQHSPKTGREHPRESLKKLTMALEVARVARWANEISELGRGERAI